MKKESIYAMILSGVAASSLMSICASAAYGAFTALSDTEVKKDKFSYVKTWKPYENNVNAVSITGVCLYGGLSMAKSKIWDDTDGKYLRFNNNSEESGAYGSGGTVSAYDCTSNLGWHNLTFYTAGADGSGHVSARATTK